MAFSKKRFSLSVIIILNNWHKIFPFVILYSILEKLRPAFGVYLWVYAQFTHILKLNMKLILNLG